MLFTPLTDHGTVRKSLTVSPKSIRQWTFTFLVVNTGVGMAEEARTGLFARVRQGTVTQRTHGGHGLELPLVSHILQLAQIRVEAHSEPAKGPEVEIAVLAQEADEPAPKSRADALRNILLGDADVVEQIVLGEQLRRKGYDLSLASTASETLEHLQVGAPTC